jgi:hypothetical protein
MCYEINISLNGQHLFATAERSITTKWEAEKIYKLFKEKFPASDGYDIDVTCWEKVGKRVNME